MTISLKLRLSIAILSLATLTAASCPPPDACNPPCPIQTVCVKKQCVWKPCTQDNGDCNAQATCTMVDGIPKCQCNPPLVGNGLTCTPNANWGAFSSGASLDKTMKNSSYTNIGVLGQPSPVGANGSSVMSNDKYKNVGGFLAH